MSENNESLKSKFLDKLMDPKLIIGIIVFIVGISVDRVVQQGTINDLQKQIDSLKKDTTSLDNPDSIASKTRNLESLTASLPQDIKDINGGITDILFYVNKLAEKSGIELNIPPSKIR